MAVKFKNNAKTTLSSGITSSATSIAVADASAWPTLGSGDYSLCTLIDITDLDVVEIVKVTAISGNNLTVVRGHEGTTARAFNAGDRSELRITAGLLEAALTGSDVVKLDSLTASATASYSMAVGGVAYSPSNVNALIVSLNGVTQEPDDAFTISGSTLTFSSALTSADSIDYIVDLAKTLNIGEPSDNTVSPAKLTSAVNLDAITDNGATTTNAVTVGNLTSTGTVEFDGLSGTGSVTVTNILDQDDMSSNSATALATQQSIKAYVDAQVDTADALPEVLSNGNTTGGTDISVSSGDDIAFADSAKAAFGAGSDLQIYHNGTNSFVDNLTGSLNIRNLADNADISLRTDDGSGSHTLYLLADGSSGETKLYHYGSQKFRTTASGIDVTGQLIATTGLFNGSLVSTGTIKSSRFQRVDNGAGFDIDASGTINFDFDTNHDDNRKANFGTGDDLQIYHDGSNSFIEQSGVGNLIIDATTAAMFKTKVTFGASGKKSLVGNNTQVAIAAGTTAWITIGRVRAGSTVIEITCNGHSGYNSCRMELTLDFNSSSTTNHAGAQLQKLTVSNGLVELKEVYAKYHSNDSADIIVKVTVGGGGAQNWNFFIENMGEVSDAVAIIGTSTTVDPNLTALTATVKQFAGNVDITGDLSIDGGLSIDNDLDIDGMTVGRGPLSPMGDNTVVGINAHINNLTGYSNVAIGNDALYFNTSGNSNIAIGEDALRNCTNDSYNIAIGDNALRNTDSSNSVAIGDSALRSNVTGRGLVAIGSDALYNNTTGRDGTAIGDHALYYNTTAWQNTAVGDHALYDSTTGWGNTAIGASALYNQTTGSYNTVIGKSAGDAVTTGSGNIIIGYVNSSGTNAPIATISTHNNRIMMGHSGITNAYVKVSWTVTSDERDKTNFSPVPHGLDFVKQLTPTKYQFKAGGREGTIGDGIDRYGFLAQDILALEGDNSVIVDSEDADNLRLKESNLIPVLVNAIKEQQATIDSLVARLDALES